MVPNESNLNPSGREESQITVHKDGRVSLVGMFLFFSALSSVWFIECGVTESKTWYSYWTLIAEFTVFYICSCGPRGTHLITFDFHI